MLEVLIMSERDKINERIINMLKNSDLSSSEREAKINEINEEIIAMWADTKTHVKTVTSLPQDVFDSMIENMGKIKLSIVENGKGINGYGEELPQDVILGHLIVEGINSIFEKECMRQLEAICKSKMEKEARKKKEIRNLLSELANCMGSETLEEKETDDNLKMFA